MEFQSNTFKNFIKGLNVATDRYNQPQGSLPRLSNLLLSKRGALVPCDGSQIIHSFNGVPTAGRGKILVTFLYSPTGVAAYYLSLAHGLDIHLGPPFRLLLTDGGAGGGLTGNVFYVVTAMDGVGGETVASVENFINLPANHKATLTWNIIPNASFYNVYRAFITNSEVQLSNLNLPVLQPAAGTLTATFTDDGVASVPISLVLTTGNPFGSVVSPDGTQVTWNTTTPHNLFPGYRVACANAGDNRFDGNYLILSTPTSTSFVTANSNNVPIFAGGGPGSVTALRPPLIDTTQQLVLFKLPVLQATLVNIPIAYNNSNIVALFPANLKTLSSPQTGGGGTGGGGVGGGGGGTGGGGIGRASGGGTKPIQLPTF